MVLHMLQHVLEVMLVLAKLVNSLGVAMPVTFASGEHDCGERQMTRKGGISEHKKVHVGDRAAPHRFPGSTLSPWWGLR